MHAKIMSFYSISYTATHTIHNMCHIPHQEACLQSSAAIGEHLYPPI